MQNEKKTYEAPKLIVHGNMAELTQANGIGNLLDGTFVPGTPLDEVTTGNDIS